MLIGKRLLCPGNRPVLLIVDLGNAAPCWPRPYWAEALGAVTAWASWLEIVTSISRYFLGLGVSAVPLLSLTIHFRLEN